MIWKIVTFTGFVKMDLKGECFSRNIENGDRQPTL